MKVVAGTEGISHSRGSAHFAIHRLLFCLWPRAQARPLRRMISLPASFVARATGRHVAARSTGCELRCGDECRRGTRVVSIEAGSFMMQRHRT